MKKIILLFLLSISSLQSKKLDKVSLQFHWKYQFEFAGFIAAKEKGFYKDVGLNVELKEYTFGVDIKDEVLMGKANYGIYNSNILLEYLKDKPVKLMASFFKRSALVIITKPEIKSLKDLVGKKIMSASKEDFDFNFKYIFDIEKINTNDLSFIPHTYSIKKFEDGKIDAMTAFISDQPYKLDRKDIKYNIINPTDYGMYNLQLELFTSENEILNYPNRTKAFNDASIKGWKYALTHQNEIIDIIHDKYANHISKDSLRYEAIVTQRLILSNIYKIGSIDENFLKRQMEIFKKHYKVNNEKNLTGFLMENEKEYNYTLIIKIVISSMILGAFSILFILFLKKKNVKLQNAYQEIELLNSTLENRVFTEVEKNKEQQLLMLHQSRLAQMGEMISMIAHQWRQPLNTLSILSQTVVLKYHLNKLDDTVILQFNESSKKQIHQMSNTIDDFRNFFKPEKQMIEFCINDVLNDTIEMIKSVLELNEIDVVFDSQEEFVILGYPNELGQALLNIINNSKDALIDNNIKNKEINILLNKDNKNITLTISDNAGGIPSDIIDKIFDPYFSTKEEKNGTGLGLYMTKLIIEDHMNGKIIVENNSEGAVFKLYL